MQENVLQRLERDYRRETAINEKVYHKGKLLLRLYRDVVWRVQDAMRDTDAIAQDFGGRRIAELADYLAYDFKGDIDTQRVQARLLGIEESRFLIELVDSALLRLRAYPQHGELYFDILTKQYIYRQKHTDAELIDSLAIERTQYYKRKKEAINLFSVTLWGYMLPPVLRQLRGMPEECPF